MPVINKESKQLKDIGTKSPNFTSASCQLMYLVLTTYIEDDYFDMELYHAEVIIALQEKWIQNSNRLPVQARFNFRI